MQIAATVVLFFPNEEELYNNINSYIDIVTHLYIIDNTPSPNLEVVQKLENLYEKVTIVKNERNLGVAAALNQALQLASQDGFAWLLTMDQDSSFERLEIDKYVSSFEKDFYTKTDVAIICPNQSLEDEAKSENSIYKETIKAITSGSIINVGIARSLKGFDEKLFIDEVDFEYCYRCIINGYKIVEITNVRLAHKLGTKKLTGYFSFIKKSNRILHSPSRVYYMVRNYFYVSNKYSKRFPEDFVEKRKQLVVSLKNNLLFSGKFFSVLTAAIKGYVHYRKNKFY